jgi:predicted acylesterase/phospholipase RssA
MRALVLSGGGARGAYEAGVVTSLCKTKQFDIVCGTSIGAINASLVAQGDIDALGRLWHGIAARNIIRYIPQVDILKNMVATVEAVGKDNAFTKIGDLLHLWHDYRALGAPANLMGLRGAVSSDPVVQILQDCLDWQKLQASPTTLVVTGTNLTRGTSEGFFRFHSSRAAIQATFAGKAGATRYPLAADTYNSAVRASAAIPGAFTPVNFAPAGPIAFDYVDGGVANNTPIGLAVDAGATEVTVVFMDPSDTKPRQQTANNMAQIAFASYDVMQQKILEDDLKLADTVNDLATKTLGEKKKIVIDLWSVRPKEPLGLSVLGFNDQAALDAAFAQGSAGRSESAARDIPVIGYEPT